MGRVYEISTQNVSVSAIQDLFEGLAADDKPIRLLGYGISQNSSTASAMLRTRIKRLPATVTSGSGGTSPAINKRVSSDAAAGFAAECNNTTQATTSGTAQILQEDDWNVLTGFTWSPTPEMYWEFAQGEALIIDLPAAPAAALSISFWVIIEELG